MLHLNRGCHFLNPVYERISQPSTHPLSLSTILFLHHPSLTPPPPPSLLPQIMSSLALTPRLALPLHTPKFTRSLLHNARPPRKPQHVFTQSPPSQSQSQSSPPQSSTFNAASQQSSSFTPGTSTPNIHQKNSNIPTQRMIDQPSVVLSYVPPSSASTNGLIGGVPDLLRWVGMGIEMDDHQQTSGTGYGHGIRSSAQRVHAPFRKTPSSSSSSSSSSTSSASPDLLTHLDALSRDTTLLSTMREMRHADPGKWTRSALIKK